MDNLMRNTLLLGSLFLTLAAVGQCQPPTSSAPPAKPADPGAKEVSIEIPPAITKHTLNVNGNQFAYTADAAQIPIRSDTGEVECRMFYVAYTKDGADLDQRPCNLRIQWRSGQRNSVAAHGRPRSKARAHER